MNIHINAIGMELTEALRAYVEKKISPLGKLVDQGREDVLAKVDIGKTTKHHQQGDLYKAEIVLDAFGKSFTVVSLKDDMYAAIDDMKDEITEKITAFRDKKKDLERKGARTIKNMAKGV